MNLDCKAIVLSGLFISIFFVRPYAQTNKGNYEIGIKAGTLIYQGDLSTSYLGSFHYLKPSLGLFASREINKVFSIRGNLTIGKISDDESVYSSPSYKRIRNLNFSTSITEISALLVWNFLRNGTDESIHKLTPYLFGGAGLAFVSIHRDWSKFDRNVFGAGSSQQIGLSADSAHMLPGMIPVIPIGAGLRYSIGPNLSLVGEMNYRFVFNDYLDGFSQAVNPNTKDKYYGVSIGLIYSFKNNGIDCPPVRR